MSSKALCSLVRAAIITMLLCGIVVCTYILPYWGAAIAFANPEFAYCYYPWLIFLWVCTIPCYAILVLIWRVSTAIKREQVFTIQIARLVKIGAILLFCDVGFFFIGNVIFALLGMSHPGVLFLSFFVDLFGVSLAVFAAVLSRYLTKAAILQEEADTTI